MTSFAIASTSSRICASQTAPEPGVFEAVAAPSGNVDRSHTTSSSKSVNRITRPAANNAVRSGVRSQRLLQMSANTYPTS